MLRHSRLARVQEELLDGDLQFACSAGDIRTLAPSAKRAGATSDAESATHRLPTSRPMTF